MTSRTLAVLSALAAWCLMVQPASASIKKVCYRFKVNTVDSEIGEDVAPWASAFFPAKYARAQIRQSGAGDVYYSARLDGTGCVNLNVSNTNWSQMTLTTSQDNFSNLMGLGSYTLVARPTMGEDQTVILHDQDCPNRAGRSCQIGKDFYVSNGHNERKYVISHEIGHIVSETSGADVAAYSLSHARGDWANPNTVTGGRTTCEWAETDHMLHSWEWSSAAYTEGWAQFYATATWNDTSSSSTAMYNYHKTAKTFCEGTTCYTNTPPTVVDMESGGNYLGSCDCSGGSDYSCYGRSSLKKGSGTELDWSRQFWDFYTDGGTPPTWEQLIAMLTVCGPYMKNDTAWESMRDGLQFADSVWRTTFWARWNGTDAYNGVNYCSTGSNC